MAKRRITHIGVVPLAASTTFVIEGKGMVPPKDKVNGVEKNDGSPTGREYTGTIVKDVKKKDRFIASIKRTRTVDGRPDLDEIEVTATNDAGGEPSNPYPAEAADADL